MCNLFTLKQSRFKKEGRRKRQSGCMEGTGRGRSLENICVIVYVSFTKEDSRLFV